MSGAFSFNELIKLIILDQAYIKYMRLWATFIWATLHHIEKLNPKHLLGAVPFMLGYSAQQEACEPRGSTRG